MVAETATQLFIGPAILMGLILSIIEIGFVHADEVGMHWITHALHAIPTMIIFTFIGMNVGWALGLIGFADNFWADLGARILIGIIAMVKIGAAASITGRGGVGEKKFHILAIGILVMASPYIWIYALDSLLGKYIPF